MRMNKGGVAGVGSEPHSRVATPISKGNVGNETKAEVAATQEGGSMAEASRNPLHGAMKELHSQHPIAYHDHGPHHGTTHHIRHEPLHGMKPGK